jgi:hypothetical protein
MSMLKTLLVVAGLGLATLAGVAAWPVVQGSSAGDRATSGQAEHETAEHRGDHDDD